MSSFDEYTEPLGDAPGGFDKDEYQLARNRAIGFLAKREHSLLELSNKLAAREVSEPVRDRVLDDLAAEGLQSERRFAESFVRGRIAKGNGPLKIRSELKQRGLDGGLIEQALQSGQTDWFELAEAVRCKRFGPGVPGDFREGAKQKKFLQYRGFSLDTIQELVR